MRWVVFALLGVLLAVGIAILRIGNERERHQESMHIGPATGEAAVAGATGESGGDSASESPQVSREAVPGPDLQQRFLEEFFLVRESDTRQQEYIARNIERGDAARRGLKRAPLRTALLRLSAEGTSIPLPIESEVWALDGLGLSAIASLLESHANSLRNDANSTVNGLRTLLENADGEYSACLTFAPEIVAACYLPDGIDLRDTQHRDFAIALAQIRDRYLVHYGQIMEQRGILNHAALLAFSRIGESKSPFECRTLAAEWVPEIRELDEERRDLGNSYYAAIRSEVLIRFPPDH